MRHPNPTLNRFIDSLEGLVERERDQWKIVAAVERLVRQFVERVEHRRVRGRRGLAFRRAVFELGYRPLAEDGVARVKDGVTTLAEVARVVDLTGRV